MKTYAGMRHRWWHTAAIFVGIIVFYSFTAGLVPSIGGHIQVGQLTCLESAPGVWSVLDAYVWPAQYLAQVPGLAWTFDLSERFWRRVTGAPICVLYEPHLESVPKDAAPEKLVASFHVACPDAEIETIAKQFGGRTGKQFIFWVIQFNQNGKRREALLDCRHRLILDYDIQDP